MRFRTRGLRFRTGGLRFRYNRERSQETERFGCIQFPEILSQLVLEENGKGFKKNASSFSHLYFFLSFNMRRSAVFVEDSKDASPPT